MNGRNGPPYSHMAENIIFLHAPCQKAGAFIYAVDFHSFMTRPLGVKVDGPTGRRLWPPDGGGLCRRVEKGKVLKMDGPSAQGFLSLTALRAEGCGLPLCGNAHKVSVTDLPFCIIWQNKHYGDQPPSVAFPPFGALWHHLPPPAVRWDNKDPQSNPFISRTTISTGYSAPACGGKVVAPATKGGYISDARQGSCIVFAAKGGIRNGAEGAVPRQRSGTI